MLIRSRKSKKNRQCNGQKKKGKRTTNDVQNKQVTCNQNPYIEEHTI